MDVHCQNGAATVCLRFLALKVAITWFLNVCKQSPYRLPRSNTNNCWHSIDTHFQDGTESVSELFLDIKAADSFEKNNRVPKSKFRDWQ